MLNISTQKLEEAIKKGEEFWFVGHDNRIFKSKINKVFCNPASGLMLSAYNKELSNHPQGYNYLNASQAVHFTKCFNSKIFAEKYLESEEK